MKTYAINGVNPNPHEHYFFIRELIRELRKIPEAVYSVYYLITLILFRSRSILASNRFPGISVINVDIAKQKAYFFKGDGEQLFLGTSIASGAFEK